MSIRSLDDLTPSIADDAYVDEDAVVIGDVQIGSRASIWPGCVIRGDIHRIRIGDRSNVQDGSVIHVTHASRFNPDGFGTYVGNDVIIGHKALLHGCTIEDRCLIGMGAIVMDGAVVRSGAIVAAGALVPPGKDLEGGYLYVGNPVRQARPTKEGEQAFLNYSPEHYANLGERHRLGTQIINEVFLDEEYDSDD